MKVVGIISLLFITAFCQERPKICLLGNVCFEGSWETTSESNQFASFQGIRFAQPPTGPLRFKPAVPFQVIVFLIYCIFNILALNSFSSMKKMKQLMLAKTVLQGASNFLAQT